MGGSHAGHSHGPGGHSHDHGSTDKTRVLWVALLTTGFLVVEAIGGILTGSLALLADAGHMLTDSAALWLAWFAFRLGERPATALMSYGFGRAKTLVAYTNGVMIFVVALWILYEAAQRFMTPEPILSGPMLAVAVVGLLVNIIGFLILNGGSKDSLNMRGALLHVLGDLLGSAGAIAAALIIMFTGWLPIDPILSVLVAVLILSTAWRLMRDAAHVLMEGVPATLDRDAIAADLVVTVQGLREVHHMHVWSLDGSKHMATLHASLHESAEPLRVIKHIKVRLASRHGIEHATVEPEYGDCADAKKHDHDREHGGHDHGSHEGHDHPASQGNDHHTHKHGSALPPKTYH